MLHFSKDSSEPDLSHPISKIKELSSKIEQKIAQKDLKAFLQDFIGVIMNATNSVNGMQGELEDLLISAEVALQQIQSLHQEMTQNLALGKGVQTRMDDFKVPQEPPEPVRTEPVKAPVAEASSINLTNPSRRIHTSDYLERSAVEI